LKARTGPRSARLTLMLRSRVGRRPIVRRMAGGSSFRLAAARQFDGGRSNRRRSPTLWNARRSGKDACRPCRVASSRRSPEYNYRLKGAIGGGGRSFEAQALREPIFDSADDRAMTSAQLSAMQRQQPGVPSGVLAGRRARNIANRSYTRGRVPLRSAERQRPQSRSPKGRVLGWGF